VTLLLALLPQTRAAFQANLGAVTQTRAELGVYEWPKWPLQDALRRQTPSLPPPIDLAPAVARYRAALALDPNNVTANRRLGQIELSQGDTAAARDHLEAAYRAAPDQRATRQLLGESYAIAGDTARAAALWRTVDLGQGQLPLREWWYGAIGETANRLRITQAIQRLAPAR
jgi:predicted Zn-dependent protease